MFTRQQQGEIENTWNESKSTKLSPTARLECMIDAFILTMRIVNDAVESVQMYWDNADMLEAYMAAPSGEALDPGGRLTKEAVLEMQILFLSYKNWVDSDASASVLGNVMSAGKTPRKIITLQPETVQQ